MLVRVSWCVALEYVVLRATSTIRLLCTASSIDSVVDIHEMGIPQDATGGNMHTLFRCR